MIFDMRGFVLLNSLERRLRVDWYMRTSKQFTPYVLNIAIAELSRGVLVNLLKVSLCTTRNVRKLSCEYLVHSAQPYMLWQ